MEFQLDTSGAVPAPSAHGGTVRVGWGGLDAFTQNYILALFFTSHEEASGKGFRHLSSAALDAIVTDCNAFRQTPAWRALLEALGNEELGDLERDLLKPGDTSPDEHAGRDFWYTRNGHGCGFWDGDWPEPYASQLTEAAKAFGECDAYLGDSGRIYLQRG